MSKFKIGDLVQTRWVFLAGERKPFHGSSGRFVGRIESFECTLAVVRSPIMGFYVPRDDLEPYIRASATPRRIFTAAQHNELARYFQDWLLARSGVKTQKAARVMQELFILKLQEDNPRFKVEHFRAACVPGAQVQEGAASARAHELHVANVSRKFK